MLHGQWPDTGNCRLHQDKQRQHREKRIFEGASIMLHLAQRYDQGNKIPYPFDLEWEMVEWLTCLQVRHGSVASAFPDTG